MEALDLADLNSLLARYGEWSSDDTDKLISIQLPDDIIYKSVAPYMAGKFILFGMLEKSSRQKMKNVPLPMVLIPYQKNILDKVISSYKWLGCKMNKYTQQIIGDSGFIVVKTVATDTTNNPDPDSDSVLNLDLISDLMGIQQISKPQTQQIVYKQELFKLFHALPEMADTVPLLHFFAPNLIQAAMETQTSNSRWGFPHGRLDIADIIRFNRELGNHQLVIHFINPDIGKSWRMPLPTATHVYKIMCSTQNKFTGVSCDKLQLISEMEINQKICGYGYSICSNGFLDLYFKGKRGQTIGDSEYLYRNKFSQKQIILEKERGAYLDIQRPFFNLPIATKLLEFSPNALNAIIDPTVILKLMRRNNITVRLFNPNLLPGPIRLLPYLSFLASHGLSLDDIPPCKIPITGNPGYPSQTDGDDGTAQAYARKLVYQKWLRDRIDMTAYGARLGSLRRSFSFDTPEVVLVAVVEQYLTLILLNTLLADNHPESTDYIQLTSLMFCEGAHELYPQSVAVIIMDFIVASSTDILQTLHESVAWMLVNNFTTTYPDTHRMRGIMLDLFSAANEKYLDKFVVTPVYVSNMLKYLTYDQMLKVLQKIRNTTESYHVDDRFEFPEQHNNIKKIEYINYDILKSAIATWQASNRADPVLDANDYDFGQL